MCWLQIILEKLKCKHLFWNQVTIKRLVSNKSLKNLTKNLWELEFILMIEQVRRLYHRWGGEDYAISYACTSSVCQIYIDITENKLSHYCVASSLSCSWIKSTCVGESWCNCKWASAAISSLISKAKNFIPCIHLLIVYIIRPDLRAKFTFSQEI